jgi:hypothetical protein
LFIAIPSLTFSQDGRSRFFGPSIRLKVTSWTLKHGAASAKQETYP